MPSRGVWIPHFVPIIHMYWSLQVIPHCGYYLKAKANYRWWDLPSCWLILRLPNQISPSTMYPLMTPPSVQSLCWKFCWGFWNLHMLQSVYSLCLSMGEWRSFMRFTWRWIWTCLVIASCTVVKRTSLFCTLLTFTISMHTKLALRSQLPLYPPWSLCSWPAILQTRMVLNGSYSWLYCSVSPGGVPSLWKETWSSSWSSMCSKVRSLLS